MHNNNNGYPSSARAWVTVAILMVAYVLSFVDRQILNLLVEPIRRDLMISDTQMSLLMGLSFALFYTVCGIPLGRVADTRSRRGLIAVGILFWSAATAACGMAKMYWQFLLCRIGVGVGEAALSPAAYSLIADSFPAERRATAISVYSMGVYLGSGLAFLVGGLVIQFASAQGDVTLPVLGEVRPWQLIFLILGVAGVLFTLLMLAVKEPARRGAGAGVAVPLSEVGRYIRANRRTVLLHNFGFAGLAFAGYGSAAWVPTFYIRTYGWDAGQVGIVYGCIVAVFGCLGIVFGGRLADWMAKRGRSDANMRVGLYAALAALPLVLLFPLMDSALWASVLLAPTVFCLSMPFGVAPAAIQEIMPNSMRGQASAIYLFVITLIGLGIGPTAVALVTDFVFADDNALRYSLLIVTTLAVLMSIILLAKSLKPYRESVTRLEQWAASPA
ncbi:MULTISPECIES: spinster family MFS transporter [Pseudomonadaceae]|uniref:Predicted arabinose efflux permease, MFS family n=3 Tax=Ectopseudomonas TaxID=3236654 RepID=A0A1H0M4U5_9GAMM|nr:MULTISPECIES: MFS transporter [Pseudomonas]ARS50349.1 MFS transporter [Pseudomonas mendocina]EJO91477.1 major facilitator superfamily transporter [Pseudomonas mendocina DLHK]ATH80910.1 MFS transporter [Pseudomonas mendocina]MBA4244098.1 Bcr/CflA family drug resistance efflux transporter [Pseudomonas sp.]MBF8163840.1 MFS transporter [Pseudomonas mendocina]